MVIIGELRSFRIRVLSPTSRVDSLTSNMSVRLRLKLRAMTIRLYETVHSIETKIDGIRKLSHKNLISQLMNSNDYYVSCVYLNVL